MCICTTTSLSLEAQLRWQGIGWPLGETQVTTTMAGWTEPQTESQMTQFWICFCKSSLVLWVWSCVPLCQVLRIQTWIWQTQILSSWGFLLVFIMGGLFTLEPRFPLSKTRSLGCDSSCSLLLEHPLRAIPWVWDVEDWNLYGKGGMNPETFLRINWFFGYGEGVKLKGQRCLRFLTWRCYPQGKWKLGKERRWLLAQIRLFSVFLFIQANVLNFVFFSEERRINYKNEKVCGGGGGNTQWLSIHMDEKDPEVLVENKQTPNQKSVLLKEAITIWWLSDRWELNINGSFSMCTGGHRPGEENCQATAPSLGTCETEATSF